jgi:hypothetical protein
MSISSTGNTSPKSRRIPLIAVFGVFAVVLAAVAVGGSYLWQNHFRSATKASAADCTLAQQILDSTATIPSDPAAGTAWETATRTRIQGVKEEFLASQLRNYVHWSMAQATGTGKPEVKTSKNLSEQIPSHCDQKIVVRPLAH